MTTKVTKDLIAPATITTDHIVDGAVDSTKLADGSVNADKLEDRSVTADKIASGAMSLADLRGDPRQSGKLITVNSSGGFGYATPVRSRRKIAEIDLPNKTEANAVVYGSSATYSIHQVTLFNVALKEDKCRLFLRFSGDRGRTWKMGDRDYWHAFLFGVSPKEQGSNAIDFNWHSTHSALGNGENEALFGTVDLYCLTAKCVTGVHFKLSYTRPDQPGAVTFSNGVARHFSAAQMSGVQFFATIGDSKARRSQFKSGKILIHEIS